MLVNLHVKNLAIIDEVEVDFSENMNVLTGETGAGKSIIIGSVNLALGGKFTGDMIRTGADQALVELLFTVDRPEQREALEALGVTVDGEDVLISRKLMQKRSVCRVNGETVTQSLIKKIAGILIDIHGQNEQQSLLHMSKHMEILDRYGKEKLAQALQEFGEHYRNYRKRDKYRKKSVCGKSLFYSMNYRRSQKLSCARARKKSWKRTIKDFLMHLRLQKVWVKPAV